MEILKIPDGLTEKIDRVKKEEQVSKTSNKLPTSNIQEKDKISLSSEGKLICKLRNTYNKLPDIRENKIQKIKEKLEEGTYKLTSEEIVSTILSGRLFKS